ncbi:hypothetical protein DSO57_1022896 [Entomophthora muscae]|uniref:Uncharacterized protein n=1 Tax=Entomophthora muscae TaxID=34485 RepID=A0ACC2U1F2_9FUNG|nr:hypothetical protein DSO57_1022896 [Entomophthora muscae]
MNHLIFLAVLTAFLGIGGHQHYQLHGPFNNPNGEYFYKEPAQLNSSNQYSWPTLVLPHSTQSVALTHAKEASEWAVTAYKDTQLDLVSLSEVYCVNSIALVWDVLEILSLKNILEMGQAHVTAYFCFPLEHTLSYLFDNLEREVLKLAVADVKAIKKNKILLADFRLAWSADKTGVPTAMELIFSKTKHEKSLVQYTISCVSLQKPFLGKSFIWLFTLDISFTLG